MTWVTPGTMTGYNTKLALYAPFCTPPIPDTKDSFLSGLLIFLVIKLYTEILSSDSMICEEALSYSSLIQAWIQDSCSCCCLSLSLSVIFCSYFTIKKNFLTGVARMHYLQLKKEEWLDLLISGRLEHVFSLDTNDKTNTEKWILPMVPSFLWLLESLSPATNKVCSSNSTSPAP